ncbi:MAG: SDR family oxidoreductase [Planctomycetes bacterium]|nr:SDR family oxidoreductase [Planctomycetota bacterium]
MKVDLSGKVALVTGAAGFLGRATARLLGENGATVVYTDLDSPGLVEVSKESPLSRAVVMNVTDETQVNAAVAQVVREFGRLDILVNNAGTNTRDYRVSIESFPKFEWDRLIEIDLTGMFVVSKAVVPQMLKQGHGRIINIASIAGLVPLRSQCAYVAAKAGVVNLTKAMAIELGSRGILSNCIAPGSILTDGTKGLFWGEKSRNTEQGKSMLEHVPLGRAAHPEEIANAILFLAAPESSYVNGAVIAVDGGWTAGYAREF